MSKDEKKAYVIEHSEELETEFIARTKTCYQIANEMLVKGPERTKLKTQLKGTWEIAEIIELQSKHIPLELRLIKLWRKWRHNYKRIRHTIFKYLCLHPEYARFKDIYNNDIDALKKLNSMLFKYSFTSQLIEGFEDTFELGAEVFMKFGIPLAALTVTGLGVAFNAAEKAGSQIASGSQNKWSVYYVNEFGQHIWSHDE